MITARPYEKGFVCVKNALKATRYTDQIVIILRNATAPMSCKEVGYQLFGLLYNDGIKHDGEEWGDVCARSAASVSHALEGMARSGHVKCERVEGEPIEIEKREFVTAPAVDNDGNSRMIKVHDDEGHEYEMINPKYNAANSVGWHWETVKKTIPTHYNVYTWVG